MIFRRRNHWHGRSKIRLVHVRRPGLGDWVSRLIQPIARRIDRRFGTKLARCPACQRRKAALNRFSAWLRAKWGQVAAFLPSRHKTRN